MQCTIKFDRVAIQSNFKDYTNESFDLALTQKPIFHSFATGIRVPDDESDRVTWRNGRVINNIFFPDDPGAESANADESVPNRFGKSRSDLDLFMGRGTRSRARGARRAAAFASRRGPDLMAMESSQQGRKNRNILGGPFIA